MEQEAPIQSCNPPDTLGPTFNSPPPVLPKPTETKGITI